MPTSAILSIDENLGLGYKNSILFNNKIDMKWFRHVTSKQVNCVVGSKTASTLPPLNQRNLFVISRDSFVSKDQLPSDYCVIGGNMIYNLFAPDIDCWYITQFKKSAVNVDTYLDRQLFESILQLPYKIYLEDNDDFKVAAYYKHPEFKIIHDFNFK